MPTIRDVAAYAEVSVATVSHVLNGTRFVEPQTEQRVRKAIQALGFRPNSLARGLRCRKTSTIGLLVPDNSNPFFADVARAIEDAGFAEDYSVILCNADSLEEKQARYIEVLLSKQIDGLILISSSNHPEALQPILDAQVPMVVVDRELNNLPVDQVLVDNEQGGYLAGQYLARLGHRRIGCITGPRNATPSALRVAGFQRALSEAGIELAPEAVVRGDFRYSGGQAAMQELLRRPLNLTAIFATNDLMAIGAVSALRRAHIQVPEDLSIIGFDNILETEAVSPAITTIAQPIAELSQWSVTLLLDQIKQQKRTPTRILLPTTLVERESCQTVGERKHMKKAGMLNSHISRLIASMGHTDMLVISDAGLPVPPGVPCIDVAISPGVPCLLDVVRAIASELEVERMIIAEELQASETSLPDDLQSYFPQACLERVAHTEFKALTAHARAVIRTGEFSPYANVILCSGVVF